LGNHPLFAGRRPIPREQTVAAGNYFSVAVSVEVAGGNAAKTHFVRHRGRRIEQ
jgi:hypothetical protein